MMEQQHFSLPEVSDLITGDSPLQLWLNPREYCVTTYLAVGPKTDLGDDMPEEGRIDFWTYIASVPRRTDAERARLILQGLEFYRDLFSGVARKYYEEYSRYDGLTVGRWAITIYPGGELSLDKDIPSAEGDIEFLSSGAEEEMGRALLFYNPPDYRPPRRDWIKYPRERCASKYVSTRARLRATLEEVRWFKMNMNKKKA